jgi:hypothetical protein
MSIISTILILSLFGKWTNYDSKKDNADQPKNNIKDSLHVSIGSITRQKKKKKHLGRVCFPKSGFQKTTFQTFLCLFAFRKVGQRKILSG